MSIKKRSIRFWVLLVFRAGAHWYLASDADWRNETGPRVWRANNFNLMLYGEEVYSMYTVCRKAQTKYWVIIVLLSSSLCYLPMMIESHGIDVPIIILNMKYLYVILPFLVSALFKIQERRLKPWLFQLFSKTSMAAPTLICVGFVVVGLSASYIYSLIGNTPDLFVNIYPKVSSIFTSCVYLFIMALFEEMAWRGFLLDKISGKENLKSLIYVGIIWGLWHIPMWLIRNSLGIQEILTSFVWTILVSIVLGTLYYKCRNIIIVAFLHMVFNVCFIAPPIFNIIILTIIIIVVMGVKNINIVYAHNTKL